MFTQNIVFALAVSGAMAAPTVQKRDACATDCLTKYNECRSASGANFASCASSYAGCLGYNPFGGDGSLATPTACSTVAAATTTTTAAVTTVTADACASSCYAKYNDCRSASDANFSACGSQYAGCLGYTPFSNDGTFVTPTACSGTAAAATTTAAAAAAATTAAAAPAAQATDAASGWTVENLIRYCSASGDGCDYNFALNKNDGSAAQKCTVIRINVADAPTESWANIPCDTGSSLTISWGYSAQFGVDNAFATLVAVDNAANKRAFFGIANVNSQAVTPSNPFGSGTYGNIGPQPVSSF